MNEPKPTKAHWLYPVAMVLIITAGILTFFGAPLLAIIALVGIAMALTIFAYIVIQRNDRQTLTLET